MAIMQVEGEMMPVSDAERKALSAWLKRGRHSKRGDRNVHTHHLLFSRRLLQAPKPPQLPQPPMAEAPDGDPAQIVYAGPVNALSVTYRVASVQQPVRSSLDVLLAQTVEGVRCWVRTRRSRGARMPWSILLSVFLLQSHLVG